VPAAPGDVGARRAEAPAEPAAAARVPPAEASHFQFWILSSIEFQINMLTRRMTDLETEIRKARAGADKDGADERCDTAVA